MPADTRTRVPLNDRTVDLAQLAQEVGAALTASETEVVVADADANVTAAQLAAALHAHTPPPPLPSPAERLAAVEAELRGMRERAAAVSATGGAAAVRDAITGKPGT